MFEYRIWFNPCRSRGRLLFLRSQFTKYFKHGYIIIICYETYFDIFCNFASNLHYFDSIFMTGIYVHIPFCRNRCFYCDFFSVGDRFAHWHEYVLALLAEASHRLADIPDSETYTLYIGGGTPSLMPPAEFSRLVQGIRRLTGGFEEFTLEVNPDDVTAELADVWKNEGVDRISMGIQSLIDSELRSIGRRHDSATAREAYRILRQRFGNISLDLIFGLPGQTLESLRKSVMGLLEMNPEHISAYSLMYEERSALTRMRDNGMVSEVPEDDSVAMFSMLSETLEEAGYEQYEISNYARKDFRSRHNSLYWQQTPYLGLGAGAHSYDGARTRTYNLPDIPAYQSCWLDAASPGQIGVREDNKHAACVDVEWLGDDELREEMIMTRLRTREGLCLKDFENRFGVMDLNRLLKNSRRWINSGHLVEQDGFLSLSREGIFISDEIISSLF